MTDKTEKELTAREVSNTNLKPGRPKGSRNKTTLFKEAMREGFEAKLKVDGMKVFDAVVQKAIGEIVRDKDGQPVKDENGEVVRSGGDMAAAKMIMDRVVPIQEQSSGVKGAGSIVINVSGMEAKIGVMDSGESGAMRDEKIIDHEE